MSYGPPDQPAHGQQPPEYGQPGDGPPPPEYGRPGYGQAPGYGSPYEQPPGYGSPYEQPPGYGPPLGSGPPPAYGAQMQPYGAGPYGYGQTTPDERQWALMGHLGMFLLGFLAPLLVYLIRKDQSAFLRHHGAEGLNLSITQFCYMMINLVLSVLTLGIWLIPTFALGIAQLVFIVLAAVAGNRGEWYRFPSFMAWPMIK